MVLVLRPPQHRLAQTRSEVQRESHGCQVRLTMAVVMCEVIACGFPGIVVLVLDVPAGSSGLHDGLHRRTIPVVRRRQRMAIQEGAVSFVRDGEFTPIDPQRVFPLTPGDVVGRALGVEGAKAPMPTTDGALREIPGGFYPHTPLIQSGGRLWVAHHDTVAVVPESPFPKGWLAVQSVPSEGHGRIPSGLPFTPALRRDLCAILWLMALWRRDERGLQGNCW